MKADVAERRELGRTFEQFVTDLLRSFDARVEEVPRGRDPGYDFKAFNQAGVSAVVEARLHQSLKISFNIWRRSVDQLEGARVRAETPIGLLVTNALLADALRAEIPDSIEVWDYNAITVLVAANPNLAAEWERISQEGFIHRSEPLPQAQPLAPLRFVAPPDVRRERPAPPPRRGPEGKDICRRLHAIKAGRGKPAIDFENVCVEALKYLFDGDLINWSTQKKSHGRLHRYDLIARIASENDFWNSLVADHRTRYLIFEFKNYREAITQSEVYSTEKYLFPQAMRSTGIIISRKGANRNAVSVTHGAFRETGKLIIILDLEQVCDMLHRRDRGEDPSKVLSDLIEDMMIGLER